MSINLGSIKGEAGKLSFTRSPNPPTAVTFLARLVSIFRETYLVTCVYEWGKGGWGQKRIMFCTMNGI